MKLFEKKKDSNNTNAGDKMAGWIASSILRMQRYFADGMGKLFARLGPVSTKVVVIGCCIFMVGYSAVLITYGINQSGKAIAAPAAINRPLLMPDKLPDQPDTIMPSSITRFHKYMDSLALSPEGRKIRDSLLRVRPGLMDSIKTVERLYKP